MLRKFAESMEHIDEIGSLARPAEDLRAIIKEEHAIWERQVREQKEANFLFPEMRKQALSGQLAFQEITDEDFSERLFYRAKAGIDAFTLRARESGEFDDQMLASETRTGFRLVDMLSRRYDVIGGESPYMGKGNMGPFVNSYCQSLFPRAFYDICMVFIERISELLQEFGSAGVVTQQTLLNLPAYDDLRRHILQSLQMQFVVQLGTGDFESIGGAKVNPILLVFGREEVKENSTYFIRLDKSDHKASDLRRVSIERTVPELVFRKRQGEFLRLPRCMVLYALPDELLDKLGTSTLRDCGETYSGLLSSDNDRLLRQQWEVLQDSSRSPFRHYTKGGPFCRWLGNLDHSVRWDGSTRAYFSESNVSRLAGLDRYFEEGLTWSDLAGIGLSVRVHATWIHIRSTGTGIFSV